MKRTIRENVFEPYSLHDMNVIALETAGDTLIMRTQSGMVETTPPYGQPDGYVEFYNVEWDFSYVYILNITGNEGDFQGQKLRLKTFIENADSFGFSVMDSTYGFNQSKFSGYLSMNRGVCECNIEICHEGDMVYVEE
ncbi:MAG: hypothetical protein IJE54_05375 [Peptococcaceae bacterium]|nr:hypothetical protein [Peptococcaceae bacterium]